MLSRGRRRRRQRAVAGQGGGDGCLDSANHRGKGHRRGAGASDRLGIEPRHVDEARTGATAPRGQVMQHAIEKMVANERTRAVRHFRGNTRLPEIGRAHV